MNARQREYATLTFEKNMDRGAVEETFHPWNLTIDNWKGNGLPEKIAEGIFDSKDKGIGKAASYFKVMEGVYDYEKYLGLDAVLRMSFTLPFRNFNEKIIKDTQEYRIKLHANGWQKKHYKNRNLVEEYRPVVCSKDDWYKLKEKAEEQLKKYYTDEIIEKVFLPYCKGHQEGEYPVRLSIQGFFWLPRELFGIKEHMMAFYDFPEVMHDIDEFCLDVFCDKLGKVLNIIPADIVYIKEDLSGVNGPMVSPAFFDEFIGRYYRSLVSFLKKKGVGHVFVDTDGDFNVLIPNFIKAGINGFLPMDVNAGMDIVEVRKKYSKLKFIGGFNKLEIARGREAIDREFKRILPVIRQGGYIPGSDHQVAPSTFFKDYMYYISRKKEVMQEAGKDIDYI